MSSDLALRFDNGTQATQQTTQARPGTRTTTRGACCRIDVAASEDELFASARQRLLNLLRDGVTTVEIKSGYGLSLESERKILRVIRRLGQELPVTVHTAERPSAR